MQVRDVGKAKPSYHQSRYWRWLDGRQQSHSSRCQGKRARSFHADSSTNAEMYRSCRGRSFNESDVDEKGRTRTRTCCLIGEQTLCPPRDTRIELWVPSNYWESDLELHKWVLKDL
ncbi:hypothetical protein EYF80_025593 [Liparis tanakae]|uniref:Uncharacterized protein n=1 Tax=Liparis tanakae TaxID=230148 RepID=A0A4Z2HG68_9TELE|nr:hypothetical protein EYF80_025593 [Liparis tanakae]